MKDTEQILFEPKSDFKTLLESVCSSYLLLLSDLNDTETNDTGLTKFLTNRENMFGRYLFDVSPNNLTFHKIDKFNNTAGSSILSDIKPHTTAFEFLNESRESYNPIFENSLVAMYTIDVEFLKILEANDMAVKLFGYSSKSEVLKNGEPIFHYVNQTDHDLIIENLKKYGEVKQAAIKLRKLDGTIFFGDFYGKLNSKKNSVQCILIDITDLKLSEEKYHDLFHNSLIPIIISDFKTQKTTSVNQIGATFFRYKSVDDFIANFNINNHFVYDTDLQNMQQDFLKQDLIEKDVVYMKKLDGTCFTARLVSKLSMDKSSVQTVVLDVTTQIEIEQKVKERTLELTNSLNREKELNEMKTRFVSYASHELRTPLSCILSSLSLIEMYKKTSQQENRAKHFKQISSSVNDLKNIMDEFLAMALLEKTDIGKEITWFNLPDLFESIIEEVSGITNAKQQNIEYLHEGDILIHSSEKILKNILLNLFSNASKYSHSGSSIHLFSSVINSRVTFSVKDHGIGIPQDDQKKLFSDFFRASNVEGIQGTGLGLNIVKKYVELLGGNISFISEVGEGTTFTVEFPSI